MQNPVQPAIQRQPGTRLIILAALVGFALVLFATRNGPGLSADSAFYLSVANELAAGHGLTVPWGTPSPTPLGTRWAPLMPAVLAAVAQFGVHPIDAVPWANALCLAGTALVCGVAVRRTTGSLPLGLVVTLLLATSQAMLGIHAMAWSEPIFIFLATCGLILMAAHLQTGRRILLVASLTAVSAAWLTRYAGASLGIAAAACLLLQPGRWRFRIAAAACAGLMAMMPMSPGGPTWIQWAQAHLGGRTEDAPRAAALEVLRVEDSLDVITNWLWPWGLDSLRPRSAAIQLVPALLLTTALLAVFFKSWKAVMQRPTKHRVARRAAADSPARDAFVSPARPGAELAVVMGVFILAYVILILAAVALFGRTVSFNQRIMLPLMPAAVMILAVGWNMIPPRLVSTPRFAFAAVTCCILVLALRVAGAADYCNYVAHGHGAGAQTYNHPSWRDSRTIAAIRELPQSATLYSNAPDAIYLLTGRNAIWLSLLNQHGRILSPSPTTAPTAYVAYFDRLAWRPSSPTREDLKSHWPLQTIATAADGSIFAFTAAVTCGDSLD